jgi:hypothetical protein
LSALNELVLKGLDMSESKTKSSIPPSPERRLVGGETYTRPVFSISDDSPTLERAEIERLTDERNQLAIQGGDLFAVCKRLAEAATFARNRLLQDCGDPDSIHRLNRALAEYDNQMKGRQG